MMKLALLLVLLAPLGASAQKPQPPDPFIDLRFFVGMWEGSSRGQPGEARVERQYEFALGGKYLKVTNRSSYQPQEKNPKGELHEDLGMMSYDKARSRVVLRQFHVEGFVNQYVLEPAAAGAKRFVFTTEGIENIPAGWRARETYTIVGPDEFLEVFELAAPGGDFETYSEARLRRKK
jgi:hypothetical protein